MKLTGRFAGHGRLRMRLHPGEVQVLLELLDDLDGALDGDTPDGLHISGTPDGAVTRRLYPSAYRDDDHAAKEFRSFTEDTLRTERHERVAMCRAELATGADVDLGDPEAARRWLQVVNDLRLTLGTELEITEDDAPDRELDMQDPAERPRLLYYWLTAVQETLVQALMR